jgi:hypothetical protein
MHPRLGGGAGSGLVYDSQESGFIPSGDFNESNGAGSMKKGLSGLASSIGSDLNLNTD